MPNFGTIIGKNSPANGRCTKSLCSVLSIYALFARLISRTFSVNEQYFFLTTNQSTVLSVMAYQPSEQDKYLINSVSNLIRYKFNSLFFCRETKKYLLIIILNFLLQSTGVSSVMLRIVLYVITIETSVDLYASALMEACTNIYV